MAQRKDNSNPQGSAEGIRGKPEPGPLPIRKMEPKTGNVLHIMDLEDGTKWIIEDEEVVELLKKYLAAPDQKTKDEILEKLELKVASPSNAAEASQTIKQFKESKIAPGLECNISAGLQKLKLNSDSKASVEKMGSDSKANKVNKKDNII
ncbi:uncharacterized protein LOC103712553 [Phoenix dactylifera]|uniref:Uncharacterized protein LOC103712553 n=1 Tax=Phoenix dactylifera TaxID=42345 RepID=A0A8B7CE48_PHODC|nr:uncharacterized protein LOC103712553 [Phoenix dactylifera]